MMSIYLLAVDANDLTIDARAIRDVLKAQADVSGWWNHLPGVFLISTEMPLKALRKVVLKATGDSAFLLTAVDLSESDGMLPDKSWEWIRRRERQADRVGA